MRGHLLDPDALVRAVASGRQKGQQPRWKRVELRYVDLKSGRHLQVTAYDATQAHTSNYAAGDSARDAVDDLLDEPFGNWHVETTTQLHQVRVTKRLEAVVHTTERAEQVEVDRGHDRDKDRLLPEDDPVLVTLGISDKEGRLKPSRQAKYRQVEEFLRLLDVSLTDAIEKGHVRRPTAEEPLRIVDLGCGNAYLTFAAQRFLTHVRGLPVHLVGVDVKEQSREHNSGVATGLGIDAEFVVGSIAGAQLDRPPEVVLALHACDTATDEALARAVEWEAALVLAAPCCHHDIAAQLRRNPTPAPYAMLDPARHPARAVRGHPDRRAAGVVAAAPGLPGRRDAVRREQAHAAQHHAPRGPHGFAGQGRRRPQGVRRAGRDVGGAAAARRAPGAAGCVSG